MTLKINSMGQVISLKTFKQLEVSKSTPLSHEMYQLHLADSSSSSSASTPLPAVRSPPDFSMSILRQIRLSHITISNQITTSLIAFSYSIQLWTSDDQLHPHDTSTMLTAFNIHCHYVLIQLSCSLTKRQQGSTLRDAVCCVTVL